MVLIGPQGMAAQEQPLDQLSVVSRQVCLDDTFELVAVRQTRNRIGKARIIA